MAENFKQQIPLILFTTLLPIAAGLELSAALTGLIIKITDAALAQPLWISFITTLLSAFLVFFHLGHKWKGAKALKGFSHSPLSREIILATTFGGLLAVDIILLHATGFSPMTAILMGLTGAVGMATALSIGHVYNLPAQLAWNRTVHVTGPLMGVLIMAAAYSYTLSNPENFHHPLTIALTIVVIIDALALAKKAKVYGQIAKNPRDLAFPQLRIWVRSSYLVKGIILLAMISLVMSEIHQANVYLAGTAILLDRFAFYASAAQRTPEAAIGTLKDERMEAALKD